ncbi:CRISPR-associated protein,Cds2-type subtype I-C/DVULG [Actinomadura rubteroloni]|uniref:CRISPR-associated protein,Cds2-type subtype I-C/DVULG n=1 Tax=Actinomadura rubteroloni TaxID=1926885 RepID=A0A2P4URW3_9ACTN|nr:type I-C CRISPR-associated protein Cas7/Csd2 [Actinomadura rubteroloni]POM27787.1 CRISPR-associated protein,Cds2-type subtype I-C/DVULG [Actinomadura rubteroloni]
MTTAPHLDPARKHDFVLLFDVRDGNPNGDPDAGGLPRTDPETGEGLVTDVAVKRKIRNMISLLKEGTPGYDIYVEAGVSLNSQHERAYTALKLDAKKKKDAILAAQRWMCETFFDVRMFGAVMSTGTQQAGRVQGPVQLTFARSVDPVFPAEHSITRVTQTKTEHIDKGETTEMGNKRTIPYGLYVGYGHFSAPLAKKTGVTSDDLAVLWRSMQLMFEHDRASSRGEMALRGLHVFTHSDAFGNAPAHELFELMSVRAQVAGPPRSFSDYQVKLDESGIPDGVTYTRVVG